MSQLRMPRRSFLGAAGTSILAASGGPALPTVALGAKRITRLIAGANPVNGGSHSTPRLSETMLRYFTLERTVEFLLHCERQGINTWQSSYNPKVRDALLRVREQGSKLQFICLCPTARGEDVLQDVLALKPLAVVHHGSVTDRLFQTGNAQRVHDFIKRVHDLGVMAGMSTHNPNHLARAEDSGWETDLYMTCVYNVTRTPEELEKMMGDQPVDELFLQGDPARMLKRVREIRKPCLAFKILAAGRVCGSPKSVDKAFAFVYSNIKPTDSVIVGMYPVYSDEVAEDAEYARKYGA